MQALYDYPIFIAPDERNRLVETICVMKEMLHSHPRDVGPDQSVRNAHLCTRAVFLTLLSIHYPSTLRANTGESIFLQEAGRSRGSRPVQKRGVWRWTFFNLWAFLSSLLFRVAWIEPDWAVHRSRAGCGLLIWLGVEELGGGVMTTGTTRTTLLDIHCFSCLLSPIPLHVLPFYLRSEAP